MWGSDNEDKIYSFSDCAAWDSLTLLQTFNAKPQVLERALLNDLQLFSDFELLEMFPPSHQLPSCFRRINPPISAIRLDPPSDCHIVCRRLFLSLNSTLPPSSILNS